MATSRVSRGAEETWQRLQETPVIPILRAPAADRVPLVVETLVDRGFGCVEVTLTTEGALSSISQLTPDLRSDVLIGVGSVRSIEDAAAAVAAGASFLVSPVASHPLLEWSLARDLLLIPAALTPTEIVSMTDAGARAVKVFPVSALGGASYIKAVRDPLPHLSLVPTGGIGLDEVGMYLAAGAAAVGLGGQLIGDALSPEGNLETLRERAGRVLAGAGGTGTR